METALQAQIDNIERDYPNYADFFLVSLQDAKEQCEKAEEFLKAIEDYLQNGKIIT